MQFSLVVAAAFAAVVSAKTDLSGCTSSSTKDPYGDASMIWYVPGSCEICAPLDCGGGRAPPKTTVPGCPAYTGTASYTPSTLTGCGGPTGSSSGASTSTSVPTVIVPTGSRSSSSGSGSNPTVIVTAPPATTSGPSTVINGSTPITTAPGIVTSTSVVSGNNGTTSTGPSSTQPFGSGSGSGASVISIAQGLVALVAAGAAYLV